MLDAVPCATAENDENVDDLCFGYPKFLLTNNSVWDSNSYISSHEKWCLSPNNNWGKISSNMEYFYGDFYAQTPYQSTSCYNYISSTGSNQYVTQGCPSFSRYEQGTLKQSSEGGWNPQDGTIDSSKYWYSLKIYRNETITESMCSVPNKTWYK